MKRIAKRDSVPFAPSCYDASRLLDLGGWLDGGRGLEGTMAYGKKRHCYICKRKAGDKEDRAEFRDDPACAVVRIYPSTPRCVPCQRLFSRKSYHVRKAKDIAERNAARAKIGMPAVGESSKPTRRRAAPRADAPELAVMPGGKAAAAVGGGKADDASASS